METFLNQRRLRDYPRLFLVTSWSMLLINILFHRGWLGAAGQLIGTDFIMLYSGGVIASQSPDQLYNFDYQESTQQELVKPTPMWGLLPVNYPPYALFAMQPLARIPLPWAFGIWSVGTILMAILAAWLMHQQLVPENLSNSGLTAFQLGVIVLSFFPFVEGLLVGQNHGLTLILTALILVCMKMDRWALGGIFAGLSIYKPQFAIGFLILWVVWGKWRALLAYALTAGGWIASAVLAWGINPFLDYVGKMDLFMKMLYVEGFGTYLEVTPYGLLTSILPGSYWEGVSRFTQFLAIFLAIVLAVYGWKLRNSAAIQKTPALILALLFPLLAAPHTLLHDLVLLVPVLILWAAWQPWRGLVSTSATLYLGTFFLPWGAYLTGIPILAAIPIGLAILLAFRIAKSPKQPNKTDQLREEMI
jgi:hypothetical protein